VIRAAALAACLAAAGCGSSQNTLTGSIADEYDLSFDSVTVQWVTNQYLVISYVNNGGTIAKPMKLTVDLTGLTPMSGQMIDLAEMVNGAERGTLQRVESTTLTFPIMTGNLVLDGGLIPNQGLCGHWHTTVTMPMGRTVNGDFCATLQVVM
jgi:hypothetical protein